MKLIKSLESLWIRNDDGGQQYDEAIERDFMKKKYNSKKKIKQYLQIRV